MLGVAIHYAASELGAASDPHAGAASTTGAVLVDAVEDTGKDARLVADAPSTRHAAAAPAAGRGPSKTPVAKDFKAVAGRGVLCTVLLPGHGQPMNVAVGNRALMDDQGVEVCKSVDEQMRAEESAGCTVICVGGGGRLLGIAAVSDKLKDEAIVTIDALHKAGTEVYLITGDNKLCAAAVAKEAGIPESHVRAEVTPAGKKAEVSRLQRANHTVCMVGGGVNDSPALAQVCQSLVLLLDVQLERLEPLLPHIVQYMLQVLTHYEAPSWGRTRDWD